MGITRLRGIDSAVAFEEIGTGTLSLDDPGRNATFDLVTATEGITARTLGDWVARLDVVFQNRSEAALASVASFDRVIRVYGFSSYDDGGGALYIRYSKALLDSQGFPAQSYFRTADRFMPGGNVDATNGGYWLLHERKVSPFMFGGKGTGAVDDVLPVNAAIMYLYKRFVGGEVDMSGGRWLIDSTHIVMKAGVSLMGTWKSNGQLANPDFPAVDWTHDRSCIILNPTYTIQILDDCCSIVGMSIIRKGLVRPTTPRTALDVIKAFSGTAITVGNGTNTGTGSETFLGYTFIIGFAYGINSDFAGRIRIQNVTGDCTNGIRISKCYDMNHLSHCHFWPFATSGISLTTYAITGAVNNGSGLIRLTIPANILVTGDPIFVRQVGGVPNATGHWIATVINATTIDLQGSTFAGVFTSGGAVVLDFFERAGVGYFFDDDVDWGQADNCFQYGHRIGFQIFSSDHCELLNCGADNNASAGDTTTIGIYLLNCRWVKLNGCRTAAHGRGVVVDTATGNTTAIALHDFWGIRTIGLDVVTGYVVIGTSMFFDMQTGVNVQETSDGVTAINNRVISNVATSIVIGPNVVRKCNILGNAWTDVTIGERRSLPSFNLRNFYFTECTDFNKGITNIYQKGRGNSTTPTAPIAGDASFDVIAQFWDGVNTFRTGGEYRIEVTATPSATSVPGRHIWSTTAAGAVVPVDRLVLHDTALYPLADKGLSLGGAGNNYNNVYAGQMVLIDGVTAPGASVAGHAIIFVDIADGDLKVRFADNVVKTIVVDV